MVSLSSSLAVIMAFSVILLEAAGPDDNMAAHRQVGTTGPGWSPETMFTVYEPAPSGTVNFTTLHGSAYNVTWQYASEFMVGKGWQTGTGRTINYTGTYVPSGNSFIGTMGWTRVSQWIDAFNAFQLIISSESFGAVLYS